MIQFVDDIMIVNLTVLKMWIGANWGWFAALAAIFVVDYIRWRTTHKVVSICRK